MSPAQLDGWEAALESELDTLAGECVKEWMAACGKKKKKGRRKKAPRAAAAVSVEGHVLPLFRLHGRIQRKMAELALMRGCVEDAQGTMQTLVEEHGEQLDVVQLVKAKLCWASNVGACCEG